MSLYTLQSDMLSKWDSFKELSESDEYKDTTSANRALPEFVIPQSDWLATEAKYKNQQAVIAQAQTALNSASLSLQAASPIITAPISGKVSGLSLQIGSVLSSSSSDTSSQKIASIQTEATPTLTLNLSEVDLPKVKAGQKATITFDSLADKSYTGEVISVDTVGSVSSGVTSYPAVIRFDTQSNDVFANMTAQANIIINTKQDVLLIPSTAIQTENGQTYVRVLKNGKEEQISVETGLASSSQIEIISGLTEGDSVITSTVTATRTGQQSSGQTQSPFSSFGGARGGTATFGGGNVVRITR